MCITTLNDLLERPFRTFSKEDQLEIVRRGRFTDLIDILQLDKGRQRSFAPGWYQRVKWLTGNTVNRKLYCWNCVLFPSAPSRLWNTVGYDDLRNLSQATKKHEDTKEHIYSTVKLRILCKSEKVVDGERDKLENDVIVKRNREYMERLIDISIALALQEIPFRHDDNEDGAYKSLVNLLRKYDDMVRTKVEQEDQFKGFTKTIQVDIVQSIGQVMRQRIAEEVAAANFFSVMVEGLPNNLHSKPISVAIRYVKNGRPIERFIGLYDVSYFAKSNEIMAVLEKELEKFGYKEKMVCQSYGGAVVKPTELYSLQHAVKCKQKSHCQAHFIHYYAHEFSDILAQSLRSIQECKLFFSIISLFCRFFKRNNVNEIFPSKTSPWLKSIPRCIKHLRYNSDSVLKILEFVSTSENFENSLDTISDAVNLINHLKSYKFMSFVILFDTYFTLIDDAFAAIKEKFPNIFFYRQEINNLIDKLKKLKGDLAFNDLLKTLPKSNSSPTIMDLYSLHSQILDNAIHEIEGRCLDIELLDFFGLVELEMLENNQRLNKKNSENSLTSSIKESYPKFFDITKLKIELDLLYGDPTICGIGEQDINTIGDILHFFYMYDINKLLPQLYKLLELIVVMPTVGEPLQGDRCIYNKIMSYCERNAEMREEPKGTLALLSIERELLQELQNSNHWYSLVTDYFAALPSTSSIELTYKNNEAVEKTKMEVITEPELTIKTETDICLD